MKFHETPLEDAYLIEMEPLEDHRGHFVRSFCVREFAALNLETSFPQQSSCMSSRAGTVRGMHLQVEPHSEVKVVRVLNGLIFDVIIDLRPQSKTFLKWAAFELSPEKNRQLYVPRGFAHGYQSLTDNTVVHYLCSTFHAPDASRGYRYDDATFAIEWPLPVTCISARDETYPDFDAPKAHA